MRKRQLFLLSAVLVLGLATATQADVPQLINYQGILLDSNADPVTTQVSVLFTIWDDPNVGNNLWSETQPVTPDANGRFAVLLGSVSPIPDTAFAGIDTYLGVKVELDPEMTPRTRLVSVAYAIRDNDWTLVDDVLFTNGEYWGIARAGNKLHGDHKSTHVNLGVACNTGDSTDSENGRYATVSGGILNGANGFGATVGGGERNSASRGNATVGGGYDNRASHSWATVGGGYRNYASNHWATVGGGTTNTASGPKSSIGGGEQNTASENVSTIAGGQRNTASGAGAAIDGGSDNEAAYSAAVAGGENNKALGHYSGIPGGQGNTSLGNNSFVVGNWGKANHAGSMVFSANAQSTDGDTVRTGGIEQMLIRADGGMYLTNTAEIAPYDNTNLITTRGGAYLSGDGGTWTNSSDRNQKENFTALDREELLEKIARLDITQWNYKAEGENIKHIGPVAQDFHALFGVGGNDKSISTVDPAGIALAAIQELHKKTKELDEKSKKIDRLETRLAEMQAILQQLLAERR